jgi:TPR repeat protein
MWWRRAPHPGFPPSAVEVGASAARAGDAAEAERWYRSAAEGGHEAGTLNLGSLLENKGRVKEAMDLYRQAWELGSDKAAFNLGRLYDDDGKGDLEAAATWYTRAAERGNAGAAFNLGFVRQDLGDDAGRLDAWRRAADYRHPKAALALGMESAQAGDEEAAIAWFRRSVQEVGNEEAAGRLAEIHRRRGEEERARFWSCFLSGLDDYSPEFKAFAGAGSAAAIHRQDVLNQAFGGDANGEIRFDHNARTFTSGGRTHEGMTLLGSFSHLSGTWLWAWANANLSQELPALAPLRVIREYGERNGVPELAAGHLDLSGFPDPFQAASTLAIAAAALLGGNGVRNCVINGGKGASFFHVDDPALPVAGFDRIATPRLLMRAAEVFPGDQRNVVRGFLTHYGFTIRESDEVIDGRSADGERVTVAFTREGLIASASVGADS